VGVRVGVGVGQRAAGADAVRRVKSRALNKVQAGRQAGCGAAQTRCGPSDGPHLRAGPAPAVVLDDLLDGVGLSSERGLVDDEAVHFEDDSISDDLVTGVQQHDVSRHNVCVGHKDGVAIADHLDLWVRVGRQVVRLGLGAALGWWW
jgi:hypothetical protein